MSEIIHIFAPTLKHDTMNKEHINSLGQRVVEVECGYKVYDKKYKDKVILRVGDTNNPLGKYIYKDIEPVIGNSDEICYMSTNILAVYEKIIKMILSDPDMDDELKFTRILEINKGCGLKGTDVVKMCEEEDETDPVDFFKQYFDSFSKEKTEEKTEENHENNT